MKLNIKNQVMEYCEKFIKVYKEENSDLSDFRLSEKLSGWSKLNNGLEMYVGMDGVNDDLSLSENPFIAVNMMGLEISLGGLYGDTPLITLEMREDEYGLVDVVKVLDYVIECMEDEEINLKLSDFFVGDISF